MATKNIKPTEFDPDINDSDSSDNEIGGQKKPLDKKIIFFFIFLLLMLAMFAVFFFGGKEDSKPSQTKAGKKDVVALINDEQPRVLFTDAQKTGQVSSGDMTSSADLLKKRLLEFSDKDFSVSKSLDEAAYQKQSNLSFTKDYGVSSSGVSDELKDSLVKDPTNAATVRDDSSNTLIKHRSSNGGGVSVFLGGQLMQDNGSMGKSVHASMETQQKSSLSPIPPPKTESLLAIPDNNPSSSGTNLNKNTSTSSKQTGSELTTKATDEVATKKLKTEKFHTASLARKLSINPSFFIPQGTQIRCVMQTMVIPDVKEGYTTCAVAENIRSFDSVNILIPKGSTVMGEYKKKPTDINRMPIIWTRVITPDNIDISLDESHGGNLMGVDSMTGYTDNQWGSRLGAALLLSLGADAFAWTMLKHAPIIMTSKSISKEGDINATFERYKGETEKTLSAAVDDELKRKLAINPIFVIQPGTLGNIYVMRDMDFSTVYSNNNVKNKR